MTASQDPRITEIVQTGKHLEAEWECAGRIWVRAYMSGGNVPMIEPLAVSKGLSPDQARILSVSLEMARDWAVAEEERAMQKKEKEEGAKG